MLPQIEIIFESEPVDARCLVVLGGRAPAAEWLRTAACGRAVLAADHGGDACMSAGVTPNAALGDFDSISERGKAWLDGVKDIDMKRFPADKDYTDFQLCLQSAPGDLIVTGCWGGRFDHAFANVFSALWGLEWGANVRAFADESEVLIPLSAGNGPASLRLRPRNPAEAMSLLPLCEVCEGVDVRGAKWELSGAKLTQRRPYAVSNVPAGEWVTVQIERGTIGVYFFFKRPPESGGVF